MHYCARYCLSVCLNHNNFGTEAPRKLRGVSFERKLKIVLAFTFYEAVKTCQTVKNSKKPLKNDILIEKLPTSRYILFFPLWKNLYSFYILNWKCTFCHLVTRGFPPFFFLRLESSGCSSIFFLGWSHLLGFCFSFLSWSHFIFSCLFPGAGAYLP